MSSYQDTLDYLYNSLPMFQRDGQTAFKKDLTNTLLLSEHLQNPHLHFKSIHVAGTNGKGSVSNMLAAIYQSAGYRVGLYTSPHLKDFRERIRVNGEMVSEEFVVEFVKANKLVIESIKPSFFEITVVMAFSWFSMQKVDLAIIEVGMGGRLDSTNIINPELSIITNIGWDHMQYLGNTLPAIAGEKAGIMKPNVPTLISEYQEEVAETFFEKAQQLGILLAMAGDIVDLKEEEGGYWWVEKEKKIKNIYPGGYQLPNIRCSIAAVELLKEKFPIASEYIINGIQHMSTITGLKGRWQKMSSKPDVICDVSHNQPGIERITGYLSTLTYHRVHIIWGMLKDKDANSILRLLPKDALYYFCSPIISRALPVNELFITAQNIGLRGEVYSSVNEALVAARNAAQINDLILVTGSNFVVAEIDQL